MHALEAEELAGRLSRFHYSVGKQENAIAGMEVEALLFVTHLRKHAERQASGQTDLLAIQIGRKMAGVGDDHLAIGGQPDGLAGGKAFGSGEDAVQGLEDFGGAALVGAAQCAHQEGDVHGGFQALAGHVANHDQQAVVARGLHVKEIAAHFVGRAVNGVDFEAGRGDFFPRNQKLLHTARGGQLAGGTLPVAKNVHETEIEDEENDEDSGEVADRRHVNGNGAGIDSERRTVDDSRFRR